MAQYATTADLADLGLPPAALANIELSVQTAHLLASGDFIDTFLRSQHTLPLVVPFPREIVRANVVLAAYDILVYRGYNPDEYDDNFRQRYEDVMEWLKMLARGEVSLDEAADTTPTVSEGAPQVQTGGANRIHGEGEEDEHRGW